MNLGTDKTNNNNQIAARDDNRKLALLVAIKRIPKPTEKDLIQATNIPKRCVHSIIKALGRMSVVIERVNGRRHGYYAIADEGAFNLARAPEVLKFNYPEVLQQIEFLALRKEKEAALAANIGLLPDPEKRNFIVKASHMG
jgi:hypothetical protein